MSEKETVSVEPTVEPVVEPTVEKIEVPKPVEVKPEPTAITLPAEETEGPGLAPVSGGAIGSTTVKSKKKADVAEKVETKKTETVALFSNSSLHWAENGGSLKKGYTIVEKARADKWLTIDGVRLATPEEVAKAFEVGKP